MCPVRDSHLDACCILPEIRSVWLVPTRTRMLIDDVKTRITLDTWYGTWDERSADEQPFTENPFPPSDVKRNIHIMLRSVKTDLNRSVHGG